MDSLMKFLSSSIPSSLTLLHEEYQKHLIHSPFYNWKPSREITEEENKYIGSFSNAIDQFDAAYIKGTLIFILSLIKRDSVL